MKKEREEVIDNDEKVKRIKIRKVLKGFIIFFGIMTLSLAMYSLINEFTPIPAIIAFIIELALTKWRDSLDPKVKPKK